MLTLQEPKFNRQAALDFVHLYYRSRGYSEKDCCVSLDSLDDSYLLTVYQIICEELAEAARKGIVLFDEWVF